MTARPAKPKSSWESGLSCRAALRGTSPPEGRARESVPFPFPVRETAASPGGFLSPGDPRRTRTSNLLIKSPSNYPVGNSPRVDMAKLEPL